MADLYQDKREALDRVREINKLRDNRTSTLDRLQVIKGLQSIPTNNSNLPSSSLLILKR